MRLNGWGSIALSVLAFIGLTASSVFCDSIELTFPGISQPSGTSSLSAPDIAGAVGPTAVAEFVNGQFSTFDRGTGVNDASVSDSQFWANAGLSSSILSAGTSNPRLIFDPLVNRWFATEITDNGVDNQILIAVSNGSNPDPSPGNWAAVSMYGNPVPLGGSSTYRRVQFPTLGLDANGLYITTINETQNGSDDDSTSVFSIPIADLTAPTGPSLSGTTDFYGSSGNSDTLGFVLQPAINFAPTSNAENLFAVDNLSFGQIDRTQLTGTSSSGASMSTTENITVQDTQFPTVPRQPDGTGYPSANKGLDPLDDRIASNVYQVGNLVYLAHTIGLPTNAATHSGIRWTVLELGSGATSVVSEGTIEDPNFDYFTPSICANADGDVILGYDRSGPSGPSGDINAFFSVGTTDADGNIIFGASQQVTFSTVSDFGQGGVLTPWGQYSSASPDPLNPDTFWLVQEVPLTSTEWTTQVTEVVVPEPLSVTLMICGIGTLSGRTRKSSRSSSI